MFWITSLGLSGLSVLNAGQTSTHLPHRMQASWSKRSFQEYSSRLWMPKVSAHSNISGGMTLMGGCGAAGRRKMFTGVMKMCMSLV